MCSGAINEGRRILTLHQLQRAIVACDKLYPNVVLDIVDDLYHSFWVEKLAIQAHDKFEPIFKARLGSAGAERVMQMVCLRKPDQYIFTKRGMFAEQD